MQIHPEPRRDEEQSAHGAPAGRAGDGPARSRLHLQGRPPLILPAAAFTALLLASLVVLATSADTTFPSPYATDAQIQAFFTGSSGALRAVATLQFAAAVPLAVLAAAVSARLHALGARAPGAAIALSGGVLASVFLAASALLTWTLSRPEVLGSPPLVRGLHDLTFLSGGPAHVVALGLLIAGIAVPSLLLHLLPRPLAVAGLALAVLAGLSVLVLAFEPAAVLLPLTRFPALLWLLAAALMLPTRRRRTTGSARADARTPVLT